MNTTFDERGFTTGSDGGCWSWGLDLRSYVWNAPTLVTAPCSTSTEGGRLARVWDECLTEWYVNDSRGLERGFTVASRPGSASAPLTLDLSIRGDLRPVVSMDGRTVSFTDAQGGTALNYSGLTVFDADGDTVTANWRALGDDRLRLRVEDAGARYPLTIDPIVQQAYLKASNSAALDTFGYPVAVDGNTVVVGARSEDSNATGVNGNQASNSAGNSGAAYVFVRSGAVWSQQAYLKASNTEAGDAFGASLAISGDVIVVGAPLEDSNATGVNGNQASNGATDSGAAYVFVRPGGVWSQQAYLKASNTGGAGLGNLGDLFGHCVAVSGDTVAVGAPGEDSGATGVNGNQTSNGAAGSGAAYVFVRSGAVWRQQAYLKASNTEGNDEFGFSIAISGNTVLAGARGESSDATGVKGTQTSNGAAGSGAAYVFVRSGAVWSQQAYLKASNTDVGHEFGLSLAVSGDAAVVGAWGKSSNATGVNGTPTNNSTWSAGAAYIFVRSGSVWSQEAFLKASNTEEYDNLGASVAVNGGTVLVGAPYESSSATGVNGNQSNNDTSSSGAVYVFVRSGGIWSQQAYLKASNTGVDD